MVSYAPTRNGKPAARLYDPAVVAATVRLIIGPDAVTELRALDATTHSGRWPSTQSGYFDDAEKLAEALESITAAKGIYIIPNPVEPALLARAVNRVRKAPKGESTQDGNIVARRWLLIDCDPQYPSGVSGISATNAEHEASLARAREIDLYLHDAGWPDSIAADSGNGGHLLYRVDLPTDDGGLVQRCLAALAERFDDEAVKVDVKVFNPSRIWKLYGTLACKGDDTPERPHRMSAIINAPDDPQVVPRELLDLLAAQAPVRPAAERKPQARTGALQALDVPAFIAHHNLDVRGPNPWKGSGKIWDLNESPLCDHGGDGPYVGVQPDGAIVAGCHHNSCQWTWADLRNRLEPREQRPPQTERVFDGGDRYIERPVAAGSQSGDAPSSKSTGSRPVNAPPTPDAEAELQVVGLLLAAPDRLADVQERLPAARFADPRHRASFTAMLEIAAQGSTVDRVTLRRTLAKSRTFDATCADVAGYLAELDAVGGAVENVLRYADAVREAHQKRELYRAGADLQSWSGTCKRPREIIRAARTILDSVERADPAEGVTTEQLAIAWRDRVLNRIAPPTIHCAPYGDPLRDLVIGEGTLTVIAGSSSHGKSALAHQLVYDALNQPGQESLKALICSVEMKPEEIFDRQCARFTGVDSQQILNGTYPERDAARVKLGCDRVVELTPRLEFMPAPFTIERVVDRAEKFGARLVLVDYLQRLSSEVAAPDVRLHVNEIMSRAKLLAGEGCGVILVSALNRANGGEYTADTISLSALRESGEIEYASDSIYFVVKSDPKADGSTWQTELICAKNRNGPKGRMSLTFRAPLLQFEAHPEFAQHDDFAEYSGPWRDDPNG